MTNQDSSLSEKAQFTTFYVADHLFGVRVEHVQEVLRYQNLTPIPLSSSVCSGLINLRGQILTAIDLRRRLGFPDFAPDCKPMNVVLSGEEANTLLVDKIGDVVEVSSAQAEATPDTLDANVCELVKQVYKLDNCVLMELDTNKAVHFE